MSLKKGFIYVFATNLIGVILSILTGFVLPKFLSIEAYSDIKLFQLYISYVGILHLGYSDGMYLKYGGKSLKDIDKKEVLAEFKIFKLFQLVVAIIGIIVALLVKNEILLFCIISLIPINVGNYLRNLYQSTGQFDKYAKFTNINNIFIFVINIFLLFIIRTYNSNYYIISYIISYFVYWLLLEKEVTSLFGRKSSELSLKYLFEDIKDGFLLMLGNFSNVIFTSIDRLLVKRFLGVIKFAYYSFAVSIESLMNTIVSPISVVMYNYICKNQQKEKIIFAKNVLLIVSSLVIALVFPVSFIVQYWIEKYSSSLLVYFLFIAQYFSIIVKCIYNNCYKVKRKQNRYFAVMTSVIVLSFILNLLGYKLFGTMEIFATATMFTSIIWFIICEIDFGKYCYSVRQYFYIIIILILFFITTVYTTPVIGLILYFIGFSIATIFLLPRECSFIKKEMVNYYLKVVERRKLNKEKTK